jgi:hypothetical protein
VLSVPGCKSAVRRRSSPSRPLPLSPLSPHTGRETCRRLGTTPRGYIVSAAIASSSATRLFNASARDCKPIRIYLIHLIHIIHRRALLVTTIRDSHLQIFVPLCVYITHEGSPPPQICTEPGFCVLILRGASEQAHLCNSPVIVRKHRSPCSVLLVPESRTGFWLTTLVGTELF